MDTEPRVGDYMTEDVSTVALDDSVAAVARKIGGPERHNGFPVCSGRTVKGFVTARDLLQADDTATMADVMTKDLLVADPDMRITDAARVILRSGIQKLPVVNEENQLVGIISNADVIRSQIERATPEKVGKLSRTLTEIHGTELSRERRKVILADLIPTQEQVYADELEGRRYELERGLAEPLVVIDNRTDSGGDGLYLADGHHRVMAADSLGVAEMDAYVIVPETPLDLGMAREAESKNLRSLGDISVVDYARHPLVETIERLQ